MKNKVRRRGQKFIRKFSRVSVKASEEGRDHINKLFGSEVRIQKSSFQRAELIPKLHLAR